MKKRRYIYSITLFVAAAVVITLLIPTGGHYMQRFGVGDKWSRTTLTAPFDFAISKSEREIEAEREQAAKRFIPIYSFDTTTVEQVIKLLNLNNKEEQVVRKIYAKGVIENLDNTSAPDSNSRSYIRIERNSILETTSTNEIYTTASALELIKTSVKDSIPRIERIIIPNLNYNQALNRVMREREMRDIAYSRGVVYQNELIVARNQIIDRETFDKLNSLKTEYEKRVGSDGEYWWIFSGHFMVVSIMLLMTFLFLYYFKNDLMRRLNNLLFVLLLYVLMVGICAVISASESVSVYIIPFSIIPIYILTFYDVRMSVYEHSTILLLCSLIVPQPIEFFFINFVAGIVAVFVLRHSYRRERIFMAAGAIFVANCVSYVAITIIQYGGVLELNFSILIWFGVNALLFLGMYQLIYVIEKVFGFVSDVSLLELCDTNQKVLLELAHKAPGTFQHSIQVANLSEAAAKKIGANPLLARTGALYHDIGKMNDPAYFIENTSGTFNPHNDITPEQSADIIRKHVTDGVAIAQKEGLPQVIIDFITGHHGRSLIYYFYSAQKELGHNLPDMEQFSYPGPKPVSREASICLMADGVEAASRTLTNYTIDVVNTLVNKIVDTQIREGQLSDSELSFKDIAKIKQVFINKLYNIYHTRITYPERGVKN